MKSRILVLSLLVMTLGLTGCSLGGNKAESIEFGPGNPEFEKAVKTGQLATIVQIIEQSLSNPCQTINLYNNADPESPREVNLINIECEGLNFPDPEEQSVE